MYKPYCHNIYSKNQYEIYWNTCFKDLMSGLLDAGPAIEFCTIVFASDLELPGFPTRNSGIRSSIHTTIIKTFSRKAVFLAMLAPIFILSKRRS